MHVHYVSLVKDTVEKTVEETKTVEKIAGKTVEKILNALRDNPKTTQVDLAKLTGLSRRGIEWNITKLKNEGRIERIGSNKGGHWKVIEQ
ncbi:Winged helix-turn-helix DNA-binding protein [compost metagenome]